MPVTDAVAEAAARTTEAVHAHGFSDGLETGCNLGSSLALKWVLAELSLSPEDSRRLLDKLSLIAEERP